MTIKLEKQTLYGSPCLAEFINNNFYFFVLKVVPNWVFDTSFTYASTQENNLQKLKLSSFWSFLTFTFK